jgi:hypothetical protein
MGEPVTARRVVWSLLLFLVAVGWAAPPALAQDGYQMGCGRPASVTQEETLAALRRAFPNATCGMSRAQQLALARWLMAGNTMQVGHINSWASMTRACEMRGIYFYDRSGLTQGFHIFNQDNLVLQMSGQNMSQGAAGQQIGNAHANAAVDQCLQLGIAYSNNNRPYGWWGGLDRLVTAQPDRQFRIITQPSGPPLIVDRCTGQVVNPPRNPPRPPTTTTLCCSFLPGLEWLFGVRPTQPPVVPSAPPPPAQPPNPGQVTGTSTNPTGYRPPGLAGTGGVFGVSMLSGMVANEFGGPVAAGITATGAGGVSGYYLNGGISGGASGLALGGVGFLGSMGGSAGSVYVAQQLGVQDPTALQVTGQVGGVAGGALSTGAATSGLVALGVPATALGLPAGTTAGAAFLSATGTGLLVGATAAGGYALGSWASQYTTVPLAEAATNWYYREHNAVMATGFRDQGVNCTCDRQICSTGIFGSCSGMSPPRTMRVPDDRSCRYQTNQRFYQPDGRYIKYRNCRSAPIPPAPNGCAVCTEAPVGGSLERLRACQVEI